MRLIENVEITDPACEDTVVKLTCETIDQKPVQPFTAGQFVVIGIPDVKIPAPAYFAIASSPEETNHYEFVVKRGAAMADHLAELAPGAEVQVEGPMGKGFDLEPFKGSDVILMGVGTGISPLRSVWRSIIQNREAFGTVTIYAGFLSPLHQLLTDEMESLSDHDIEVKVSLDRGDENWDGPIGYVQDALLADHPDSSNSVVCLAGMSAMVDACKETLQNLGFDDSRILLNF
ncbi:MAG TPA: FAD-binding oxidoreductase [Mariprofundaceae bacterium]|nr:FAD-binding oxidoreductase [Mariprofundaceae bacterium]